MAFQRVKLSAELQAELKELAAQARGVLYGEAGCPEWGTKFREIEQQALSAGMEFARLVMEQTVAEQAQRMPASALEAPEDEVSLAGTEATPLETGAGVVSWEEPRATLKRGRKAFFPTGKRWD